MSINLIYQQKHWQFWRLQDSRWACDCVIPPAYMRLFSLAPFLGGCDVPLELFTNHCHAAGGKPWGRACPESQGESLQGSTGGSSQVSLGRSRTRSLSVHPDMQGGTGGLCEGAGMWPHEDCGDAAGNKSEFWKHLQPAIPFTASHQELKGKGGDERRRTSLWGLDCFQNEGPGLSDHGVSCSQQKPLVRKAKQSLLKLLCHPHSLTDRQHMN